MDWISLVIVLIIISVFFVPMDNRIKGALQIVLILVVVLWLLEAFGLLSSLRGTRVGK